MLKKVVITNYLGETMEYNIDGVEAENPSGLIITSIDGLGPVKADINMTDLTTTDGQLFNSARLSGRNIVIKALFTHATSIEEARLLSYKYFPIKKKLKIRVETDNRIGETEGYVESNEPDIFSEQSGCQISILCENPYFDGGKIGYTFGDTVPLFKFQFGNEDLNEPLIKLSEQIDITSVREIVYDGDADTGMEIAVEVPSDDIMDTFKVTGIEILGENDKKISIDTSKMVNQVPNTSPTNVPASASSFLYDLTRIKYLQDIPADVNEDNYGWTLFYNGQLHHFRPGRQSGMRLTHLVLEKSNDSLLYNWVKLANINLPSMPVHSIVNLNGSLFAFSQTERAIARYDESTNAFIIIAKDHNGTMPNDFWDYTHDQRFIQFVYHDHIHFIVDTTMDQIGSNPYPHKLAHYIYDGRGQRTGWEVETDIDTVLEETIHRTYALYNACVTVYNDKVYLFGGNVPDTEYSDHSYAVWDGNTWIRYGSNEGEKIPNSNPFLDVVAYRDKMYIFGRINPIVGYKVYSYDGVTWTDVTINDWTNYISAPYDDHAHYTNIVADDEFIYIVGGNQYTESPNNDHLIEHDKLVINTNKGKKGITLYRDFKEYNALNALGRDSTWLQLHRGVNRFSYTAETGAEDMEITISTNKWYEGV